MKLAVRRRLPALILPLLVGSIAAAGCDIVTADMKSSVTDEWRKTYTLDPGGKVEINNVNGRIRVDLGSRLTALGELVDSWTRDELARSFSEPAQRFGVLRVVARHHVDVGFGTSDLERLLIRRSLD